MSKTLAFFGPTGGCANACLAYTLLNGYNVIALARTPSKLTTQLLEQPGLTNSHLEKHLRIIQGDATDISAITQTLIVSEDTAQPILVSTIISGIGGTGTVAYTKPSPCDKMTMRVPSLPHVVLPNPHITEEFSTALLGALRGIEQRFPSYAAYAAVAPRVTVISSTGIKKGVNDVPFWFRLMYDTLLPIPHKDKMRMEEVLQGERDKEESLLVGGLVVVRPSFLSGEHVIPAPGEDDRYRKLKVGTDSDPALGYTVPKVSIGRWIYEEVVKKGGDEWVGQGTILTE